MRDVPFLLLLIILPTMATKFYWKLVILQSKSKKSVFFSKLLLFPIYICFLESIFQYFNIDSDQIGMTFQTCHLLFNLFITKLNWYCILTYLCSCKDMCLTCLRTTLSCYLSLTLIHWDFNAKYKIWYCCTYSLKDITNILG